MLALQIVSFAVEAVFLDKINISSYICNCWFVFISNPIEKLDREVQLESVEVNFVTMYLTRLYYLTKNIST